MPEENYGGFSGGDPRAFWPDPDASSPEQRDNWRKACRQAVGGEMDLGQNCLLARKMTGDDRPIANFGHGVYQVKSWEDMTPVIFESELWKVPERLYAQAVIDCELRT